MCLSSTAEGKEGVMSARPVVAVEVTNPMNEKVVRTYAMLHGGSEFSIMDQALAGKLGIETMKEEMTVTTLESTIKKE